LQLGEAYNLGMEKLTEISLSMPPGKFTISQLHENISRNEQELLLENEKLLNAEQQRIIEATISKLNSKVK